MAEIVFRAEVGEVKTGRDGNIHVVLVMDAVKEAAALMVAFRIGAVLDVRALVLEQNNSAAGSPDGKKGRPARKSLRSGSEFD